MKTLTSPPALAFIRGNGGDLFVWGGDVCCGGTRFIKTSTEAPIDAARFTRFDVDGYRLFVRPVHGRLPDELRVDMRGALRLRVEAYWNGCAYVL
jgi:hypothetical protein